jgi:3-hydroxymyristoyl/3-hydroxydecanoyl-(acyl carrier protein) dehydratase
MIDPKKWFDFKVSLSSCHVQCASVNWKIPADLPYFEGHFPGNPIFPAVATLDGTLELVRRVTEQPQFEYTKITSAKFTGVMTPEQEVIIEIHKSHTEWKAEWKNSATGVLLASIAFF